MYEKPINLTAGVDNHYIIFILSKDAESKQANIPSSLIIKDDIFSPISLNSSKFIIHLYQEQKYLFLDQ